MKAILALSAILTASANAATIVVNSGTLNTAVPDNDDVGITDTRAITTQYNEVQVVTLTLNFSGGWNGDLYAYLIHDSGFSVLLNRPGRTVSTPDGAASSGMSVTFDNSAASDIHTAIPMSGGTVTGTFQPDGRIADPAVVLDTHARTATLSSFTGLNPNGSWTLFVADQSPGAVSTLQSWTLTVTAIPEPSSLCFGICGLAIAIGLRRRVPHKWR